MLRYEVARSRNLLISGLHSSTVSNAGIASQLSRLKSESVSVTLTTVQNDGASKLTAADQRTGSWNESTRIFRQVKATSRLGKQLSKGTCMQPVRDVSA